MHHVRKSILKVLTHQKRARFSELRPPRVDSNLFSYHLSALLKEGLVEKLDTGYALSTEGLAFVDRVSMGNFEPRLQPKIITMIVALTEDDCVLLQRRSKQPFIDMWTLPSGKLHLEDASIRVAAEREMREKTGIAVCSLEHVSNYYIQVRHEQKIISSVLAHVFLTHLSKEATLLEGLKWYSIDELSALKLAPAIGAIIEGARNNHERAAFRELQINFSS